MSDFMINTANIAQCGQRFTVICNLIQQQTSIVDNVASDLCGIGLGELDPTVETIREQLNKQNKNIQCFSETLGQIVKRYIQAEESIVGNAKGATPGDVTKSSNTGEPSIDDFWNDDTYFCEGWYRDKSKLIEAYKKLYKELLNGRIDIDALREGFSEDNPNPKVQLLQLLLGANPTGVVDEFTYNMLELNTDDFATNDCSFGLEDFLSFGNQSYNKWNFIFSLLHQDTPGGLGGIIGELTDSSVYNHNSAIESNWSNLVDTSGSNGLICTDGVHTYINDQEGTALSGMYFNGMNPEGTSAGATFCENIAIYNAMEYWNPDSNVTLSEIVQYNTENGNLMGFGALGTDPYTIPGTMEHYGYSTTNYPTAAAGIVTPDTEPVVIISTMNNQDNVFDQIHTYTLTAEINPVTGDLCYVAHNSYVASEGKYYDSVGDFLIDMDARPGKPDLGVLEILGVSTNE
ncbi:MAG: hypothetical protein Q4D54_07450 [Eubacteriales bacterium]|nr:hypothetical protein [Lachnospiraceae bacterium]MDO5127567.1 hypothetical protein [Eubacteriales bacterium]